MIHLKKNLNINATPSAIWAVMGQYMHIDEFAPQVTSVDALTKQIDGIGAKRRCHFENGTSMVEEVIEWQANQGYRVQLSDLASMPIHEMSASLHIEPLNNGQSNVIWTTDFRPKFGLLGWLLGQTMMRIMMGKILDGNLKGLEQKVQSSQSPS